MVILSNTYTMYNITRYSCPTHIQYYMVSCPLLPQIQCTIVHGTPVQYYHIYNVQYHMVLLSNITTYTNIYSCPTHIQYYIVSCPILPYIQCTILHGTPVQYSHNTYTIYNITWYSCPIFPHIKCTILHNNNFTRISSTVNCPIVETSPNQILFHNTIQE